MTTEFELRRGVTDRVEVEPFLMSKPSVPPRAPEIGSVNGVAPPVDAALVLPEPPRRLLPRGNVLPLRIATERRAEPAGRRPSDRDLTMAAIAAIRACQDGAAMQVTPVVRDGWVILEGEVEHPRQKRQVEDAVRQIEGLRGFSDNIVIASDALALKVGRGIEAAFVHDARLHARRVIVSTHDRRIILSGTVRNAAEREQAEEAAWSIPGVAAVINRIQTGS